MRILVSGGQGRLATHLGAAGRGRNYEVLLRSQREMDVAEPGAVERELRSSPIDVVIHAAATLDLEDPDELLRTNIIGTAMVVAACRQHSAKLVYISTDHVYPAGPADHDEHDPLLPFTPYGWSKLGGECAVRTYPRSLIIRGAFCPTPYPHPQAFHDVTKNPIYQDTAAEAIMECLDIEGVLNLGGDVPETLLNFARRTRPDVREATSPPSYQPKRGVISTKRQLELKLRSSKS